jgi:DNA-binding NtrC family response regulator
MPEGGKLTIEASNSYLDENYCRRHVDVRPGQYVQIAVTDTGSGMAKEVVGTYVVETLLSLSYDVLEAGGAEGALRLIDERTDIRLLLTDVVMTGMNGRKLAEEAKRRRPELKILYMTGYSRNAIVHQDRLDAGVDLVQKPVTSEQLARAVRKAFDA